MSAQLVTLENFKTGEYVDASRVGIRWCATGYRPGGFRSTPIMLNVAVGSGDVMWRRVLLDPKTGNRLILSKEGEFFLDGGSGEFVDTVAGQLLRTVKSHGSSYRPFTLGR